MLLFVDGCLCGGGEGSLRAGELVFAAQRETSDAVSLATLADLNLVNCCIRDIPFVEWSFIGVAAGALTTATGHRGQPLTAVHVSGVSDSERVKAPCLWGNLTLTMGMPLLLATATIPPARKDGVCQTAVVPVPGDCRVGHKLRVAALSPDTDAVVVRLHHVGTLAGGIFENLQDDSVMFSLTSNWASTSMRRKMRGLPNYLNDQNFTLYKADYFHDVIPYVSIFMD